MPFSPRQLRICFLYGYSLLDIAYQWNHTRQMVSCVHLAKSFWGLSMLWYVSLLHSFSYLSYIPLYGQTIFWLSVHLSIGIWVISTFGLLWIMRLWTFMCMSLCEHVCLVFLSIYLGGGILGHTVTLHVTFKELLDSFLQWLHHFTFPPAINESSHFFLLYFLAPWLAEGSHILTRIRNSACYLIMNHH